MGHALKPRNGILLSAIEVAERLRKSFPCVKVDEAEGLRQAHARADWIERAQPGVFLGRHKEALAFAAKLRDLEVGDALSIEFGDSDDTVTIVVLPGELIQFSYRGKDEENQKRGLVERCARALDSDVELF